MTAHTPPTVLRRLDAHSAPLAGELLAGDPPTVWTDADLWTGMASWRAEPHGNVLAPLDAGCRDGRRGVIIPHCPRRLQEAVAAGAARSDGAAVTAAVSLLRGAAEADRLELAGGGWWLTADGRPVLAAGTGAWREEADHLLEKLEVGRGGALSQALAAARAAVADPRVLRRDGREVEASLFAAAAPGALLLDDGGAIDPSTSADGRNVEVGLPSFDSLVSGPDEGTPRDASADSRRQRGTGIRGPGIRGPGIRGTEVAGRGIADELREAVRRHLDQQWAERLAETWSRMVTRGASRSDRAGRRRAPIVVGLIAGAVVLGVGATWPDDEAPAAGPPSSVPPTSSTLDAPSPARTPTPATGHTGSPPPDVDAAEAAVSLLKELAACEDDDCRRGFSDDPARIPPPVAASPDLSAELIDDYGGVSVVRASAKGHTSDLVVVLVRTDAEWLVRDLYEVADQP